MQMFQMKTGRLLSTCASLLEHWDFYPVKPPTLNCTVLMAVLAREKQRHCRQRSTDNIFALDLVNLQTLTFGSCSCELAHTHNRPCLSGAIFEIKETADLELHPIGHVITLFDATSRKFCQERLSEDEAHL